MDVLILEGLGLQGDVTEGLTFILKLALLSILVAYLVYAFLLTLRIRILEDTVKANGSSFAKLLTYTHLFVAVAGSFFAVILILIG